MKNKNWWKAAGWRALRTVAQTALAGMLSVLTSIIKGIPEADEEE